MSFEVVERIWFMELFMKPSVFFWSIPDNFPLKGGIFCMSKYEAYQMTCCWTTLKSCLYQVGFNIELRLGHSP